MTQYCIVATKDGPVRGYIDNTDEGTFYRFKGIPYALPPVKSLRFLPPSPIKPWTEIKDCTKEANIPISLSLNNEIVGSEDCLYIEVTSPCVKHEKPLPVMFWIGGFMFIHLTEQNTDHSLIVKEDVVFVNCGYRVGPFGFLSSNDFVAPGNYGLKDIVLALRWVQNNIAAFGGDPNNVTIFGSSSGGVIVHLLMLSPMATGLFHKAIIQSASALCHWAVTKIPLQPTMELVKELGINKSHMMDIIEELRYVAAEKIMECVLTMNSRVYAFNRNLGFDPLFRPCIEDDFEGQSAFITKSTLVIIKSGNFNKVPLIIGSNNLEAAALGILKNETNFQDLNGNFSLLLPKFLTIDCNIVKQIGQQFIKFYLDNEKHADKPYVELATDYHFLFFIHKTVEMYKESAPDIPIYYYVMNQIGEWYTPPDLKVFNSSGHFSMIPFIFGLRDTETQGICKGSRAAVLTRRRVIRMWTNFAKYGNPTPDEDDKLLQIKWDPVENKEKLNFLSIDSHLTKGRNPFPQRIQFWEDLHTENRFLRILVYFQSAGVVV